MAAFLCTVCSKIKAEGLLKTATPTTMKLVLYLDIVKCLQKSWQLKVSLYKAYSSLSTE